MDIRKELKRMWRDLGKSTVDTSLIEAGIHPETTRRRDEERRRREGRDQRNQDT